ncbi:hypothetical protein LR48_Vigan07g184000 [Vigna angularis]|uniref:Uncharacterized protein n=1 Tax=Phaseolus angularis TaxID=3914 RepID=A0A0L9UZK3_PHAAN|nr:hypothetical protein LR48_Vigan07g184000 [Vigna angularis]
MIEDQPPSSQHDELESSLPTENTQQTKTSTHVGCESSLPTENTKQTETSTQVGHLEGVIKKIKVKVKEVNNLPSRERIIVEFDEIGMPIGEGQGVLTGYCGILATDGNFFPINFGRWSGKTGMPNTYFLECFKKMLQFMESGQLPSRGKLYIEAHKRKDRSFVNDAAKDIAEQIEVSLTQSTTNESEVSPNDVVGKVLGLEHSGRVQCMGLGAAPTNAFRNTRFRLSDLSLASSTTVPSSSSSNQWQQKYNNLESAFKAYMIMKEGKIPDELISFFDRQPQEGGNANEPESPLDTIGSSGASNI